MTERVWFKIGEAARQVGASPKELRYWEKVIPELKARRSKGNLRYYHVDELPRLRRVRAWLDEGLPVSECRERLRLEPLPPSRQGSTQPQSHPSKGVDLAPIAEALRALLERLGGPPAQPVPPARRTAPKAPTTPVAGGRAGSPAPPSPTWIAERLPLDLED